MSEEKQLTVDQGHRYFGVEFNNKIFAFADKKDLSEADKLEVVSCAYAALLHWQKYSGHQAVNTQRGLYMLAKAHIIVEDKIKAKAFAQQCMDFTHEHLEEVQDFDVAYSHEIYARAAALNGDEATFKKHYEEVQALIPQIEKEGDRKWVVEDVKGGNWFGMV